MRLIYIIENVNFMGGAHVATASLLRALREEGIAVDVLTDVEPTDETRQRFGNPTFHFWHLPMRNFAWFVRGLYKKAYRAFDYPDWTIDPRGRIRQLLRSSDCVCVMSEMSPLRRLVSNLPDSIRKVQLIHNDYIKWAEASSVARRMTGRDVCIYRGMTQIAVVGAYNAKAFATRFPQFADKTTSFYNLIEIPHVERKNPVDDGFLKIITVSRCDDVQKACTRNVHLAMQLIREGLKIRWTFMGGGYDVLAREVASAGLSDHIIFPGVVKNPIEHLGEYDVMALLSHYEGVPMVVYESFVAGTPVLATNVSGMRDQIQDGVNGWLVEDDGTAIVLKIRSLCANRQAVASARGSLAEFNYANRSILNAHKMVLGIAESCK